MPKENKEKEDADIIVVTEPVKIDDGKHTGTIINVTRILPNRDEGRNFDYLDLSIKVTDVEKQPELKAGFPTNISELSSLGRLLKKAGMSFESGDEIKISDIKNALKERDVTFLSKNEKTQNGEFARIIRDTIEFA